MYATFKIYTYYISFNDNSNESIEYSFELMTCFDAVASIGGAVTPKLSALLNMSKHFFFKNIFIFKSILALGLNV